jgi:hypothetical protein
MESLGYWEFLYQSSSFGTCLAICCRFDNGRRMTSSVKQTAFTLVTFVGTAGLGTVTKAQDAAPAAPDSSGI